MDWKNYMSAPEAYSDLDEEGIAEHLSGSVKFPTVADFDFLKTDQKPFLDLHEYLKEAFPLVHKHLKREVINQISLLYTWEGSERSKDPVLFMAHLDVVPVTPGTEDDWTYPAYSGQIAQGCVWGRGSKDCKGLLIAELEAAEYLLSKGFTPKNDVYFAFGHDEEVLGGLGAAGIVKTLKERGVHLSFVLDEGSGFEDGARYGAPGQLIAEIAVGEKGYLDAELTVEDKGGHSSMPQPGISPLSRLAEAILKIDAVEFKTDIPAPIEKMYRALSPYIAEEPLKTYASDPCRYREELIKLFLKDRMGNAFARTTTAGTQLAASPAPNILPQKAQAVFNFRLSPWDNVEGAVKLLEENLPEGVGLRMIKGKDPSRLSDTENAGFAMLKELTEKYYAGCIAVPFLMLGGTDSILYEEISDNCYRFSPFIDSLEYHDFVHATNERSDIKSLVQGVKFLIDAIQSASC